MSKKLNKAISKTAIQKGIQCPKAAYLYIHKPELRGEIDPVTQANFDEGNEVGELAREHFGKGTLVDVPHWSVKDAVLQTEELIKKGEKTIYEATFLAGDLLCKVDILARKPRSKKWRIIEVKKGLTPKEGEAVKDSYIYDIATQAVILHRAGIEIESCEMMLLNRECQYPKLDNLFGLVDVTEEVDEIWDEVEEYIDGIEKTVKSSRTPQVKIGRHCLEHCGEGRECDFTGHCWEKAGMPDKHSIFDLPGIGFANKKNWERFHQGQKSIHDLDPKDFKGKAQEAIFHVQKNKKTIKKTEIKEALNEFKYPLYFLDFETSMPAVPRYRKSGPYSQIVYQFSCHKLKSKSSKEADHFEYLHTDTTDPRPEIAKRLVEGLGKRGSIVAYNASFEKGVIEKLAELYPKLRKDLLALTKRLVDPLPIFRSHVYMPEFYGSFSIKTVAPAILGKDFGYSDMEVGHGLEAGVVAEAIMKGQVPEEEKEKLIPGLLAYCRQDTEGLMKLVQWLEKKGA